jgi:hypothetical protein
MPPINSIHCERIHKRQYDEDKDRPLLGKPKTKRKTAEVELIQRLNEDNTEKIGNDKPNGKEHKHQTKVLTPMGTKRLLGARIGVVIR